MIDPTKLLVLSIASASLLAAGCDRSADQSATPAPAATPDATSDEDHADGDGHAHDDHDDHAGHSHAEADHHDEVPLGAAQIGDLTVEFAQGHGELAPGRELHLVIKLPYSDKGATTIRVWLGTEDRFASVVAKAEYAPSHDDYDVHAIAPDPLPENTMWWVEIEKPSGEKLLGNVQPK